MMHLEEITAAVELGRAGDREAARTQLTALWGACDDRQTRCAIAHYLADVQDETEDELSWDLRALENVDDDGWLPSLHLNLADDYRRLARTQLAEEHLSVARAHLSGLPEGGLRRHDSGWRRERRGGSGGGECASAGDQSQHLSTPSGVGVVTPPRRRGGRPVGGTLDVWMR